jgi:hypothetical protein
VQRAQLDRAGVRFEAPPELAGEASAPAVQVSFDAGTAEAQPAVAPSRGYAAGARAANALPLGAVSTPSTNVGVPTASASPTSTKTSAAQAPGVPGAAHAVDPRTGTGPAQVRVAVQGTGAPNAAGVTQQTARGPADLTNQPAAGVQTSSQAAPAQGSKVKPAAAQANLSEGPLVGGTGSVASRESDRSASAGANRAPRTPASAGDLAAGRVDQLPSSEPNAARVDGPMTREVEPSSSAQPAPAQSANAASTNAASQVQRPATLVETQLSSVQPVQATPVPANVQLEQAVVVAASTTREEQASGDKPRAAKGASDPMARVEGFSRGARFGAALSAYSGRGHEGAEHDTRGKRSEERERDVSQTTSSAAESFTQVIDQSAAMQPAPTLREAPAPELVARTPAVPVAVPVPEQTDIEFSRTPVAQPQNASISLHHPDLGPIQIQVQRMHDRVEVSAVIESAHAEAVLRANESGIRIGVQQSGMTFGALKVKLRGQERERDKDNARPGQERRRRGIERGI